MKTTIWIKYLPLSYALLQYVLRRPHRQRLSLDSTRKRSAVSQIELANSLSHYQLDFQLGTPPQSLSAVIDTGSNGFIVQSAVRKSEDVCSRFYHTDSTTFHKGEAKFTAKHIDGDTTNGFYGQDKLDLGSIVLEKFEFAVATHGSCKKSVVGLGLEDSQTTALMGEVRKPHASLLSQLKESGAITHAAFSLWFDSASEGEGHLIFGGLDRSRTSSDMYIFPIVRRSKYSVHRYELKMHEIYYIDAGKRHHLIAKTETSIVLDSSTGITRMPLELLIPFYQEIGAKKMPDGTYDADCEALVNGGGFGLVLSGVEYIFEFHDVVIPNDLGYNRCIPGILPGNIPILGSNFMRSLYVVYDTERFEIGIAAARTDSEHYSAASSYEIIHTRIPGTQAPLFDDTVVGTAYTVYSRGDGAGNHIPVPSSYVTIGSASKVGIRVPYHFGGGVLPPGVRFDIDSQLGR